MALLIQVKTARTRFKICSSNYLVWLMINRSNILSDKMLRNNNNGLAIEPPAYGVFGFLASIPFLINLAITIGSELFFRFS